MTNGGIRFAHFFFIIVLILQFLVLPGEIHGIKSCELLRDEVTNH